jgi:hypothetical protein
VCIAIQAGRSAGPGPKSGPISPIRRRHGRGPGPAAGPGKHRSTRAHRGGVGDGHDDVAVLAVGYGELLVAPLVQWLRSGGIDDLQPNDGGSVRRLPGVRRRPRLRRRHIARRRRPSPAVVISPSVAAARQTRTPRPDLTPGAWRHPLSLKGEGAELSFVFELLALHAGLASGSPRPSGRGAGGEVRHGA